MLRGEMTVARRHRNCLVAGESPKNEIPRLVIVLCFQWYLLGYQGIWAVPLKGWSVTVHPVRSTERDACPDFFHRERQHNAISRASPIPISAKSDAL